MKSPTHDNDASHRADLYEKFNDFVRNRGVSLSEFWKSWKVLVQPEEFRQYFSDIRFQITHDDYTNFLKEISSNDGVVMLELFAKKVPNWMPSVEAFKEEIKERALRVETQKRAASTQFRIKSGRPQTSSSVGNRPYSGGNGGISRPYSGIRPISGVSTISYKSKGTQPSEYPLVTEHQLASDKTKFYLKKAKEREKEMEKLLNLAVMKGKNEKEYEALVKMGEANEISQSIGSTITYRAFRAADGTLRCHVYDLDKFVKEMTIEEMAREYKVIKQNQKLASNKPIWESLAAATKSGAGLLPKDVIQKDKKKPGSPSPDKSAPQGGGDGKAKGNIDRKERQNEIKLVLAETMELTTILKYQLKILEKRGINLQGTNMSASMTKIGGSSLKNSGNV